MLSTLWHSLSSWAIAHPLLAATLLATAAASVLSSVWYAVRRAVWPGVETAKLPTWARVVQALVELMVNVPGFLRALAAWPSTPPGTPPPRESSPPPAPRRTPTVIGMSALVALAALLVGCPLPPPDCAPATAGAPMPTRCSPTGVPQVCSPEGRWSSTADTPCTAAESVCCLTRSPYGRELFACARPEACLPLADAGAPEGGAR